MCSSPKHDLHGKQSIDRDAYARMTDRGWGWCLTSEHPSIKTANWRSLKLFSWRSAFGLGIDSDCVIALKLCAQPQYLLAILHHVDSQIMILVTMSCPNGTLVFDSFVHIWSILTFTCWATMMQDYWVVWRVSRRCSSSSRWINSECLLATVGNNMLALRRRWGSVVKLVIS